MKFKSFKKISLKLFWIIQLNRLQIIMELKILNGHLKHPEAKEIKGFDNLIL